MLISVPEVFVKLMTECSVEEAVTTLTKLPWETVVVDTGAEVVFVKARHKRTMKLI